MAGYQTQPDSGTSKAYKAGDLVQALGPEQVYDYQKGLPQLGDLLPIDTQLLSPAIARAFNLPIPAHLPSSFARSGQQTAQVPGSPPLPLAPHNNSLQVSSPQPTARTSPAAAAVAGPEVSLPSTIPSRSGAYPPNLNDFGLQQHFQQHLQQYQQRGGEAARTPAFGAYDPSRSLLEQERMQQLAHQYATAAASYNSAAGAQPLLRSPATAYQPMNVQAAQAAMYGYPDAAADAKAAAMAQYAGMQWCPRCHFEAH